MWEDIERLQQGESLNIQDVKTNLFWEFGKFTSHDGETMESYYTRNANPLALVATAQSNQDLYYQTPKSHKPYAPTSKASIPTRSHAPTRNKGKEIVKPITPSSESASEEDIDPEQAKRDKDMQKNLALTAEPSTPINVYAEENNGNQAEEEFTNPFCILIREVVESSSHNIGNSNVHTFNQPQDFEYRWTKDHLLEQVRGNPSKPVQTRRQLATDHEMSMFTLTVNTAELKNIKEAMADSTRIEAIQEELHQFDRL
nr:hypothetical protein [Tanacetum cinerariifolium]